MFGQGSSGGGRARRAALMASVAALALTCALPAAPSAAAPPVCSPPEHGKCIPTPEECATGEFNGSWQVGGTDQRAECDGGGGHINSYAGGDASTPCGVVIKNDRMTTGSWARDPNLCFPPQSPAFGGGRGRLFRQAAGGRGGVVAAQSPAAAAAGVAVLDAGGNAMDAAVAATFAIGVARPDQTGIGGGGYLVYRGANGETAALDFRETYPAAITADNFGGPHRLPFGHRWVGVPGAVAGMAEALGRFGTISLAEAISPAERLAREGITVSPYMHDMYYVREPASAPGGGVERGPTGRLRYFPESADTYLEGGAFPPSPGTKLPLTDYANSLKLIAERGPDALYRGPIAELIVADMERSRLGLYPGSEGAMTADDLAAYRPIWRDPLKGTYRGHEIVTVPPSSAGGIFTIETLNILEGFDLRPTGHSSADHLHLLAEAQKLAWADRTAYVADPNYVDVPTARLTSKEYAATRRAEIDPAHAKHHGPGEVDGATAAAGDPTPSAGHTSHVSVIDADGNAVAVTNSVGSPFGSAVVAPGTGFPLNNQLGGSGIDSPAGGKRPRSEIAPTIVVRDGKPVLVAGGGGATYIPMGVVSAISALVDFEKGPAEGIDAARVQEFTCCSMDIEDVRVTPDAQAELEARGHTLSRLGEYFVVPYLQLAGTDPETGARLAASDPREEWGSAAQAGGPVGAPPCLPGGRVGRRGINRVRLGHTRRQTLRRLRARPVHRTRRSYSWCVAGSTGRVSAVFGTKKRVQLVVTTSPAHRMRRVRVGVRARAFRRAFPRHRRVARGIHRLSPNAVRVVGLRAGRVRFLAVSNNRLLRRPRVLRRHVRPADVPRG